MNPLTNAPVNRLFGGVKEEPAIRTVRRSTASDERGAGTARKFARQCKRAKSGGDVCLFPKDKSQSRHLSRK